MTIALDIPVTDEMKNTQLVLNSFYAMRLLRLPRILGKYKGFHRYLVKIKVVFSCFYAFRWTLALISMFIVIFSVVGMNIFGADQADDFGDITKSIWTMFQVRCTTFVLYFIYLL